ncbi:hypothetical protein N7449_006208 [Penicillium cf. viridicatum]|uniref:NAD-dependent epimerase/dehydratase domain-containing protein n=1 Tax=Penicillium cf. viridicatum TaxID=2972119 RepID=A0A9W9MBH8_9EURO|nr:hypothetical protein N7449_006208 [Penicillium cf. viridicatum]
MTIDTSSPFMGQLLKRKTVIASGSLILVTGANGYIASHVVNQLLQLGYNVRGTIRAEKPWLEQFFAKKYGEGRFETMLLPAFTKDALEPVLRGVSGVINLASDVSMNPDPHMVIPLAVGNVLNLLETAAKQPSIRRVVLTSSTTAAFTLQPGKKGVVVGNETWNDESVRAAWDPDTPSEFKPFLVYTASKTEAERKAWEWVRLNEPSYGFNSVLPFMNAVKTNEKPVEWYVNVEDTARLHVIAALDMEVESERLWACAAPMNWAQIIGILQNLRPNNTLIPTAPIEEPKDYTEIVGSRRALQLLRAFFGISGWTSLEQSLESGILDLP